MNEVNFPVFDINKYNDEEIKHFADMNLEFNNLIITAQKTAIKDKFTQYYKKLIDEEQYTAFHSTAGPVLKQLHNLKQEADNITDIKQGKNSHCFYTINFRPEFNTNEKITEIEKELKEFTEKCKYVGEKYAFCIEQRSEDISSVNGVHCHILFEKGENAPSKIQRAFKNKFFDKFVGTPACLDYRYTTSDKVTEKLSYILGIKKKEKMSKVYIDRQMRKNLGLQQFYEKGFNEDIEKLIKDNEIIF
jgi:acetone carboxylase gamma subunit